MDKNQGAGIVWAAAGIIYTIVIFLADFDTKVVVVGALLLGLLAVTSPWWRPMIGSSGPDSGN
jgi:hypothetical protein